MFIVIQMKKLGYIKMTVNLKIDYHRSEGSLIKVTGGISKVGRKEMGYLLLGIAKRFPRRL